MKTYLQVRTRNKKSIRYKGISPLGRVRTQQEVSHLQTSFHTEREKLLFKPLSLQCFALTAELRHQVMKTSAP